MARPSKNLDLDLIEKLASIHCSNHEIASIVGCDPSLLSKKRYSVVVQKGKERGKMALRRKMFEGAMAGNVSLQIWLSKNILGFSDKVEQKIQDTTGAMLSEEELAEKAKKIAERVMEYQTRNEIKKIESP